MSIPGIPPAGRIESLHLAHLLARCWAGGFSGSFRAQGLFGPALTATKEILFERGRIAWAASDDARESIRTYLLNRGLLRAEQWKLAQEKAGSATPRQTLLDLGFLSARELQDADRERVSGIVLSLFSWAEGEYATTAAPLPPGTPNLKIDPRDLVLEGIMSSGDRERVLAELESLDSVLVVRPDDLVRASLSMPVELVELMGRADGTRTVADICALSPLSDFMISAAFAALKILGLATPAEGSAAAAPPAPPRSAGGSRAGTRRLRPAAAEYPLPLPLGAGESGEEPATTQVISTPPQGTAMESREHALDVEEEDDSGTIPMEATPPEGTPRRASDEEIAGRDEPGTQPMTATPPGGQPAVNDWKDTRHQSDPGEDQSPGPEDREGETELSAGIPLPPAEPEAGDRRGLGDDEIESAVQMFDGPDREEPAAPFQAAPGEGAPPESEVIGEAGSDGREPEHGSGGEVGPAMEEGPAWTYEPSGPVPPAARSRPWTTWGAIAAGIFAVGTILTMIMGGGGDAPPPEQESPPEVVTSPGPPPVEVPEATEGSGGGPAEEDPTGQPAPETPPVPPEPAPRKVAAATPEAPPRLASTGGGSILGSASFLDAREDLEAGKLAEAARGFQASVGGRTGLYTVQLALACQRETVTRAIESIGGAQEFFILPKEFNGRACYKLLWGAYPGRSAAEDGRSSVPRAFQQAKDKPFVAPI